MRTKQATKKLINHFKSQPNSTVIKETMSSPNIKNQNNWEILSKEPQFDRSRFGICSHKNQTIIVVGGFRRCKDEGSVVAFNIKTCKSTQLVGLDGIYEICSGTILQNNLYIVKKSKESYVERLNLSLSLSYGGSWEKIESSNCWSWDTVLSDENKLFVISSDHSNKIYDPRTNHWNTFPQMKIPRDYYSSAIVNNEIYVIGGVDNLVKCFSLVEVYNISSQSWTRAPDLPSDLGGSAAVVHRNRWIIVTGGCDSNNNHSSQCYLFDTQTQQWMESCTRLTAPRLLHGCVLLEGFKLVLVGGLPENDYSIDGGLQEKSPCRSYMESIDIAYLLPNWYIIDHLVLLRHLIDKGRAYTIPLQDPVEENGKENSYFTNFIIQKLMKDLDLDMFRAVLSFLIPD